MNVKDALYARRSIRQFEEREIPSEVLDRVIEHALQSPSGGNAQPYRIAVAQGSVKEQIRLSLSDKFIRGSKIKRMPLPKKVWHGVTAGVMPDGDYNPDVSYPEELKKRKFECGMGLYETLGIERNDYAARDKQMLRNFEFFDAPAVIFLFINDKLGMYGALDGGIFLQSLMLAAVEEGLGTCPQAALATWRSPVSQHFNIEDDYKLICGLSIGYPAEHLVNSYCPSKRSVENVKLGSA